jgi:hypothetical protein
VLLLRDHIDRPAGGPGGGPTAHGLVRWLRRDLDHGHHQELDPDALYRRVAAAGAGEPMFLSGRRALRALGYQDTLLTTLDGWRLDRFLGLACPWRSGLPPTGTRVLDLGSGAGVDSCVAAVAVGGSGRAVAVDLRTHLLRPTDTPEPPLHHVLADSSHLPLHHQVADLVVANGLPPLMDLRTAPTVLEEIRRALSRGGELRFSALVAGDDAPLADQTDLMLINSVRTGKPLVDQYRHRLLASGFDDIEVVLSPPPFVDGYRAGPVSAVLILARRC